MFKIKKLTCENREMGCITDATHPKFSFTLENSTQKETIKTAVLSVNNWEIETNKQIAIPYEGKALMPFSTYRATLTVTSDKGEVDQKSLTFETGRMDTPWQGQWISDAAYHFNEKKISPIPFMFKKQFSLKKKVKQARLYVTALGVYELQLNGEKVGEDYFAPGFTSYKHQLQYQTYDVTHMLNEQNCLVAIVGGGWAVGAFVMSRKNKISADRQALLMELHVTYEDGTKELIKTDPSWQVTQEGNYRYGDFYDGEVYDATINLEKITWRQASIEKPRVQPKIIAAYGAPVREHETMMPISMNQKNDELIYDFGQNFAGVVKLKIKGKKGQVITVKHAEVLNLDGTLNTSFLRTAKAQLIYTCREGVQDYSPKLTYMGFRYISIKGIEEANIEVCGKALYSEMRTIGTFTCSNAMINQLQNNIVWSAKSNFLDIPTDCPQRDERMGWTGDIAVFAQTACYNFDISRFLEKWLIDLCSEQRKTGGIPNTIPSQGYGFPETMPTMAIDFWGDACVLVPWALYMAQGDLTILEKCYETMKKYVEACKFWAGFLSIGKHKYIWHTLHLLHFGDWVTPDVPHMSQWQKRSKWTATASLKNTSGHLAKIAALLGKMEDAKKYRELSAKVADAYESVFTDGNGKLYEEFQTGYVLPIHFNMLKKEAQSKAVGHLVKLIENNNYCIGTGFPGTPYILFALADNGYTDVAYKMLLNTKCPSWLYQVKMGATTIWERWDGLDENGVCPIGDDGTDLMISYNHYASGAVGDFFYKRIVGIEAIEPAYKRFRIAPLVGGELTFAKGSIETPYGKISSEWQLEDNVFTIQVEVPIGTGCELKLPNGKIHYIENGCHSFNMTLKD